MVVFFFIGMVSISAQYVSNDEAILILKAEITNLQGQVPNASPEVQNELAFQYHYMRHVVYDLQDGAEVGAAIYENEPIEKSHLHSSGFVYFTLDNADKQAIASLVAYVDDLLSD